MFIAVTSQASADHVVNINGLIEVGNASRRHQAPRDRPIATPTGLSVNPVAIAIDASRPDRLIAGYRTATGAGTGLLHRPPDAGPDPGAQQNRLAITAEPTHDRAAAVRQPPLPGP